MFDFPDALKAKLLEYLPTDDTFVKPPVGDGPEGDDEYTKGHKPPSDATGQEEGILAPDERRRAVWSFVKNAPKRADGAMVAVVTSTVTPWPHQFRAYKRMLDAWPFRLLVADEVGLGKTVEAGLIIRHAWISDLAKRVLIMAPKGILLQWQAELYEKFNLLVPIYDGQNLCLAAVSPTDRGDREESRPQRVDEAAVGPGEQPPHAAEGPAAGAHRRRRVGLAGAGRSPSRPPQGHLAHRRKAARIGCCD